MAEEKGRGSGLRSRVVILRRKAHLKVCVRFIFGGVGMGSWHNWSGITFWLQACLLGTLLLSLFQPLLGKLAILPTGIVSVVKRLKV